MTEWERWMLYLMFGFLCGYFGNPVITGAIYFLTNCLTTVIGFFIEKWEGRNG